MMKWFINPRTGQTVQYPDHFAELKPYLIEADEKPVCETCLTPGEPLDEDEGDILIDDEDDIVDEDENE